MSSATGDYAINAAKTTCTPSESLTPGTGCAIGIDFIPSIKTKGLSDTGHLQVQTDAKKINPKNGMVELRGGGH